MKNHHFFIVLSIILVSCQSSRKDIGITETSDKIRINQIGYEINSPKRFIVSDTESETFEIINESGNILHEGNLADRGIWKSSGESVKMGDFSSFNDPGTYRIRIENEEISYPYFLWQTDIAIFPRLLEYSVLLGQDEPVVQDFTIINLGQTPVEWAIELEAGCDWLGCGSVSCS